MLWEPLIAAEISFVEFWNSNRNEEGELKESKISWCLENSVQGRDGVQCGGSRGKMRSLRYKWEGKAENPGKIVKTTVKDKEKILPILKNSIDHFMTLKAWIDCNPRMPRIRNTGDLRWTTQKWNQIVLSSEVSGQVYLFCWAWQVSMQAKLGEMLAPLPSLGPHGQLFTCSN